MKPLPLWSVSKCDDYCVVVRAATRSRAVTLARRFDPSEYDEDRRGDFTPRRMECDYAPETEGEAVWTRWTCDACDEAHIDLNGWFNRSCRTCERGTVTFDAPDFGTVRDDAPAGSPSGATP